MLARLLVAVRALRAPVGLGVARARAVPSRWALPALGVALATALLVAATGGGAVAGEQAARDAVRQLTPVQRAIYLNWAGGAGPGVDAGAVRSLRRMTPAPQTRSVLYLATVLQRPGPGRARRVAQFAAIAPLGRWVKLTAGRLPRTCTPARCEVLAAGGGTVPTVLERSGTRLVTVGRATLRSVVPLGFVPGPPRSDVIAEARPRPLLLGADPRAADDLPGFGSVFRTQGWSAPLDTAGRPSWRLGELDARIRDERAAIGKATDSYTLTAPDGPLQAARARADEARDRVLLVAAGAAALLSAFIVLSAAALRRDLDEERARLERRGGRRWQLGALAVTEAAWPALAGVLSGAVAGVAVTALRAGGAGVPSGELVAHALLTGRTAATLTVIWLASTALLLLAARRWTSASARSFDVAAVGAAGALALALSRGGAADPGDTLPALLPPLACLVAGIAIARLAPLVLRGAEVLARRGPLAVRLAGLGLARRSGGPALTIAVVAVGCGLSCFAWAYRATLQGGDRDQAAYGVPLDVTVREGSSFTPPLQLASHARWRALAGGGTVLPVQRTSAAVPRGATTLSLPLLGVPASGLGQIHGWRDGDASASRGVLARRLTPPGSLVPRGAAVTAADRTLTVRAGTTGDSLELTAVLRGADGRTLLAPLGPAGPRTQVLTARLPARAAGLRLAGISAVALSSLSAADGHQEAENPSSRGVVRGELVLRDVRLGGRAVATRAWRGSGPLGTPRVDGGTLTVPFTGDPPGRAVVGPVQPGDGLVVPVLTDPVTAASAGRGGLLPLGLPGQRLRARVVGTVRRFPTVEPSADGFVVADEAALAAAIDATEPGLARPDELWIAAPRAAESQLLAAVRATPLRALEVSSRRAAESHLRADPLSRELVRTLLAAGVVALLLAALGVLVAVALAVRDDAAELYDLETLGVDPGVLRTDVRLRATALASAGLVAGLGVGGVLVALAVDAVQVTATGVLPVPPLVAVVPLGAWLFLAAAFAVGSAAGVALLTRRALGGPLPVRTAGGPR